MVNRKKITLWAFMLLTGFLSGIVIFATVVQAQINANQPSLKKEAAPLGSSDNEVSVSQKAGNRVAGQARPEVAGNGIEQSGTASSGSYTGGETIPDESIQQSETSQPLAQEESRSDFERP